MKFFQALQIVMTFPESSEAYKAASADLTGKEIEEDSRHYLNLLFGEIELPFNILTADEIKSIPNLFRDNADSSEHDRLSRVLDKMVEAHQLDSSIINYFNELLISNSQKASLPFYITFKITAILLHVYCNQKDGSVFTNNNKQLIEAVRFFLSSNGKISKKIPEKLIHPLIFLKKYLYHDDRAVRLQARHLCESLQIPLNLTQMLNLSMDGVTNPHSQIEDVIIVIGATGSGKSTIINYLSGIDNQMIYDETTGNILVEPKAGQSNQNPAKIGHDCTSKTLYPQIMENEFAFVDCPGFYDTRFDDQGMCAALGVPLAVHHAKKIRAVVVVLDWQSTDPTSSCRGAGIRELSHTLSNLFDVSGDAKLPIIFAISKPPMPNRQKCFDADRIKKQVIHSLSEILKLTKENSYHLQEKDAQLKNLLTEFNHLNICISELRQYDFSLSLKTKISAWFMAIYNGSSRLDPQQVQFIIQDRAQQWRAAGLTEYCIDKLRSSLQLLLPLYNVDARNQAIKRQIQEWQLECEHLQRVMDPLQTAIENFRAETCILSRITANPNALFVIRGYQDTEEKDDHKIPLLNYLRLLRQNHIEMDRNRFMFNPSDSTFWKVRDWAEKSAQEFISLFRGLTDIPLEISHLKDEIKRRETEKDFYQRELVGYLQGKSGALKEELENLITKKQQEISYLQQETEQLLQEKVKLEAEINNIETAPAVDCDSQVNLDERSWLGSSMLGRLIGIRTKWVFEFSQTVPIQAVEISCVVNSQSKLVVKNPVNRASFTNDQLALHTVENSDVSVEMPLGDNVNVKMMLPSDKLKSTGYFMFEACDLEKGIFKVTYFSNVAEQGCASVRIFAFPKDIPSYQRKLAHLKMQIESINKKINSNEREINWLKDFIENDDKHVKSQLSIQSDSTNIVRIRELIFRLGYTKENFIRQFNTDEFKEIVGSLVKAIDWDNQNNAKTPSYLKMISNLMQESDIAIACFNRLKDILQENKFNLKTLCEVISLLNLNKFDMIAEFLKSYHPISVQALADEMPRHVDENSHFQIALQTKIQQKLAQYAGAFIKLCGELERPAIPVPVLSQKAASSSSAPPISKSLSLFAVPAASLEVEEEDDYVMVNNIHA